MIVGGICVKMVGNVWIFLGGGFVSVFMDLNLRIVYIVGYNMYSCCSDLIY